MIIFHLLMTRFLGFNGFTVFSFSLRYHNITGDVLTSIKRTEDSLMRLKRSRKQQGTGSGGQTTNQEPGQSAMSDDDKIRHQFTLDTEEFGRVVRRRYLLLTMFSFWYLRWENFWWFLLFLISSQIEELGVEENRTPAYSELVNTVKAARTSNSGANWISNVIALWW